MADDLYQAWYQAKLWALLPAVYRNMDVAALDVTGPLQELMNRIGAQVAVLRRGIDRLGENQSIETCDDWAIPYIGDLVATRLVSCLDAPSQRRQVAKTIYYRRRAGTLGLLEELVTDIASRDARAVEFFRRLGRTRHQFDPAIGNAYEIDADPWTGKTNYLPGQIVVNGANAYVVAIGGVSAASGGPTGGRNGTADGTVTWNFYDTAGALAPTVIQGLAGVNSRTPLGGFADLRSTPAAAFTDTAFDEFAHTADLRAGAQHFGRENISHLGMFVWWLHTYAISAATPCAGKLAAGQTSPCYTFDPSGRQIPLYAPTTRTAGGYGDDWVSPDPWQLPLAISAPLYNAYPDRFYGEAFSIGLDGDALLRTGFKIHPEIGQFSFTGAPPQGALQSNYVFGLMSTAGAGAFPFTAVRDVVLPTSTVKVVVDTDLANALNNITGDVTIAFQNSITFTGTSGVWPVGAKTVALSAISGQRPLVRWPAGGGSWTFNGAGGNLILQGFWLQGANITLTGDFASVTLQLMTLDPGTSGQGALYGTAVDGLSLAPTQLIIQASVQTLTLERCITGSILTQNKGIVETLTASDSIIQAIPTGATVYALSNQLGEISLARCTVMGANTVHQLDASDCILDGVTMVEDLQHGCVRFSALALGSQVHQPYRCVTIPPNAPIYYSRRFGDPNYARLSRLVDAQIVDAKTGDTILGGADNGAEMGAWQSEGVTLKRQGLVFKFQEFAPLGVFPVWIDAD
jgi:hypothetical protein